MIFVSTMVNRFAGLKFSGRLLFRYYDRTYIITEITETGLKYRSETGSRVVETLKVNINDNFRIESVQRTGSRLRPGGSVTIVIRGL